MSRSFIGRLMVTLAALVLMRRRLCYQEPTHPDRPPSGEQHNRPILPCLVCWRMVS